MYFQDINAGFQNSASEEGTIDDAEWWAGEPALLTSKADPERFFASVLDDLADIDSIKVKDMEWLDQGEFRVRVETMLTAFKAKGGEVVYKDLQEFEK
ncbi:MAG: hypothetical protein VYE56_08075 [Pseudomonadota bacterium]|nr:hypothetical protein [Pseudomonadota bacterium]